MLKDRVMSSAYCVAGMLISLRFPVHLVRSQPLSKFALLSKQNKLTNAGKVLHRFVFNSANLFQASTLYQVLFFRVSKKIEVILKGHIYTIADAQLVAELPCYPIVSVRHSNA